MFVHEQENESSESNKNFNAFFPSVLGLLKWTPGRIKYKIKFETKNGSKYAWSVTARVVLSIFLKYESFIRYSYQ